MEVTTVAIVYENNKPIRFFKGEACLFNAYRWTHKEFHLHEEDPPLPLYKLPAEFEVKCFLMTEEQINEIIK